MRDNDVDIGAFDVAQFFTGYGKLTSMKQEQSTPKQPIKEKDNKSSIQPDPETLGTTDPQEHMEGPISSLVQMVKDGAEDNDKEDKANHKARADENKK